MSQALRCTCGKLNGQLNHPEKGTRLKCYCKDCQAFAHYLGRAADMLDAQGGSDIVATHPQEVVFSSGAEAIACMSLTDDGMLRWYASCCNTPIGNTSRTSKLAFVGLSSACLGGAGGLDAVFGPVRMVSGTQSARGQVASTGIRALPVFLGFGVALLRARLNGSYAHTPFFKAGTNEPLRAPTVLARQERERLRAID
ncbi:MAG: DUF6151 family protein [Telluria sp.]